MYDYTNVKIDELKQLKTLYSANMGDIYRLQQTNKYLKRNILDVMHSTLRMPFVFSDKVFRKEQSNDKDSYNIILELLQEHVSKDIKRSIQQRQLCLKPRSMPANSTRSMDSYRCPMNS